MAKDPIWDVARAETAPALWKHLIRFGMREGFPSGGYYLVKGLGGLPTMNPHTYGFSRDAVHRYVSLDFRRLDLVPRVAMARGEAVTWHEAWESSAKTAEEQEFRLKLREVLPGPGLGFPCYGPRNCCAYVALSGYPGDREFTRGYLRHLQYVFQAAHLRLCSLLSLGEHVPHLSVREKEVLKLVSIGKSNSVIGELLCISANTVDTHLRRIYQKMGVTDRTSAAIKAVGGGIIST